MATTIKAPQSKRAKRLAGKVARARAAQADRERWPKAEAPPAPIDINEARDALVANLLRMPWESRERELENTEVRDFLTPAQYNRLIKQVSDRRAMIEAHVRALQKQCYCRECRKFRSKPLPAYYVPRYVSYECAMSTRQAMNGTTGNAFSAPMEDGLEEELEKLSGRAGFITPSKYKGNAASRRAIG